MIINIKYSPKIYSRVFKSNPPISLINSPNTLKLYAKNKIYISGFVILVNNIKTLLILKYILTSLKNNSKNLHNNNNSI